MSVLLTDAEVIDIELNLDKYLKRFLFYMRIAFTVVCLIFPFSGASYTIIQNQDW